MVIAGFYCNYIITLLWLLLPVKFNPVLAVIPFLFTSVCPVLSSTCLSQYFIHTVPPREQVAASMLIAVGTGVFAGLPGMIFSSLFLKAAAYLNTTGPAIVTYKYYFLFILCLLPLMSWAVHRLYKEEEVKKMNV
jgi:hypothetical protein